MKITIVRTTFTPQSTIGRLSVDGAPECYTLEDQVRPDGVKIHGETAIPKGLYSVELTMSPRFKRVLPLLINVKGFVGIRIHPGNTAADTEGCILVGNSLGKDFIGNSRVAFDKLFARMQAAAKAGDPITVEVL